MSAAEQEVGKFEQPLSGIKWLLKKKERP